MLSTFDRKSIHPFVMKVVVCESRIPSHHFCVFLLLPLKDLVGHQGVDAAFAIFMLILSGRPSFRKQHRFSCTVWVDGDFCECKFVEASLHCRPRLVENSSVINENLDRCGIRSHVSEGTSAWAQRLRPLLHPAAVVNFRRASVWVRDPDLSSKTSQKFVGYYCELLFQSEPELEKK